MKRNYLITLILLFILISSSLIVSSDTPSETDNSSSEDPDELIDGPREGNLLDKLLSFRFQIGITPYLGRYFNNQLIEPTPIKAFPDTIELEYMNETTIQIGGKDPTHPDEWQKLFNLISTYNWGWVYNSVTFKFELIYPENISKDALNYYFDPPEVSIMPSKKTLDWENIDSVLKTNLTLKLLPSKDGINPTQDFILKVKITRIDVSDPTMFLKKPDYINFKNYKKNIDIIENTTLSPHGSYWGKPINWIKYPITGLSLWNLNKNKNKLPNIHEYLENTVNVLVRVKKDHFAELIPPEPFEIHPNDILSVPVTLKNLGSHLDTFNFRVINENDEFTVAQPSALTIEPGEEKKAYVAISAPPRLQELGKTISIKVEAYSIDKPDLVFSNDVILTIEGVYVSFGIIYYVISTIVSVLILLFIIKFLLNKFREKTCKKPDKPWNIPEEKKFLNELKEKDKEKYKEVLGQMKDEYQSSLLWYKYYYATKIRDKRKAREKAKLKAKKIKEELEKKLEKPVKEKPKKKEKEEKLEKKEKEEKPKEEEKIVEEEVVSEPEVISKEETKQDIDIEKIIEENKKQKLINKIKRLQEKQRRKLL